jgi:hypothetical protein
LIGKFIKLGIPLLVLIAVVVAIPVLTASASPKQGKSSPNINKVLHTVQGEVTTINKDVSPISITIINGDDKVTIITVNETTEYYIGYTGQVKQTIQNRLSNLKKWIDRRLGKDNADIDTEIAENNLPENRGNQLGNLGLSGKRASFTNLSVGDRIIARVNSTNQASRILIVEVPTIRQVKGTIKITGNTFSIQTSDGTTVSGLICAENTRTIIKGKLVIVDGDYAVVTYDSETMIARLVNLSAKAPVKP